MGIRYSIDLYFPLEGFECVLEELIELSEQTTDKRMAIRLLNGRKIVVPHTMPAVQSKENRSFSDTVKSISFTTSLLLAEDQAIKAYIEKINGRRPRSLIDEKHSIGNFIIGLDIGTDYAVMRIISVASSQNSLLADSEVIHQHIRHILNHCSGLFALLNVGTNLQALTLDKKHAVEINTKESPNGEDIDYEVKSIQQQIGN